MSERLSSEQNDLTRLSGGIENGGATCYISVVLQLLLRYKGFTDLLARKRKPLARMLRCIFQALQRTKLWIPFPASLCEAYGKPRGEQQDACEFLEWLINSLAEEIPDITPLFQSVHLHDGHRSEMLILPVYENETITEVAERIEK